jgi:hypothetical protein
MTKMQFRKQTNIRESGLAAKCRYLTYKKHFAQNNYNMLEKSPVRMNLATYLKQNDHTLFDKFAKKYTPEQQKGVLLSNFMENPDIWVLDLLGSVGSETYHKWLRKIEEFDYHFASECSNVNLYMMQSGSTFADCIRSSDPSVYPELLNWVLRGQVSVEFLLVVDWYLNRKLLDNWSRKHTDPYIQNRLYLWKQARELVLQTLEYPRHLKSLLIERVLDHEQ